MTRAWLILALALALCAGCATVPSAPKREAPQEAVKKPGAEKGQKAPDGRLAAPPTKEAADKAFAALPSFQLGGDETCVNTISAAAVWSHGSAREQDGLAERLAQALDSSATLDCKRFVCRQLVFINSDEAVPALSRLLTDKDLSDMARYAVESLPGRAAGAALRSALDQAQGKARIGLINSLAQRRDSESVGVFVRLVGDSDHDVARAAAAALGKVGGSGQADAAEVADNLLKARATASAAVRPAIDDALLSCAGELSTSLFHKGAALSIYKELYAPDNPESIRIAAFTGMAAMQGKKAAPLVAEALKGKDPSLREAAVRFVREIPGKEATEAFAGCLSAMTTEGQTMVIRALADRGDAAALPAVTQSAHSSDEAVRLAALRAMESLGGASSVVVLASAAANEQLNDNEREAARRSLSRLRGTEINGAIENAIGGAAVPACAELVRALGARLARQSVPILLKTASGADATVRRESIKSLGALAGEKDLPALLDILVKAPSEAEQAEAAKVIVAIAQRPADESKKGEAVLAAYRAAKQPSARVALLYCMGRIGAPSMLKPVGAALKDKNEEIQKAAILALGQWPGAQPIDLARDVAANSSNPILRVLAVRAYARLIALPSGRSTEETARLYEEGMRLATQTEEKRTLLSGLGAVAHPRALKLAEACIDAAALQSEALAAAAKIYQAVKAPGDKGSEADREGWKASASLNGDDAPKAIDADKDTLWTTNEKQRKGQWFTVDLGKAMKIRRVAFDTGKDKTSDYPRGYEVYESLDGKTWGPAMARGEGTGAKTDIAIYPRPARYVKIVLTAADKKCWWTIGDLKVFAE